MEPNGKWIVRVIRDGKVSKEFVCESKGQARRKAVQARGSTALWAGRVVVVNPLGKEEVL